MNKPLVSIIMPVLNGEKFIKTALNSIIDQTYDNIELIVVDGGSTDNTVKILESYNEHLVHIIRETDEGMYNAINKGFQSSSGEIMCWLNSDDIYFQGAIQNVVKTFNSLKDIEWVTGRKVIINQNDQIIKIGCFRSFFRSFIRRGLYRGDAFGFISQESTFWKRSLFDKAGYLNEKFQLASDFELWTRFAEYAKLYSLNTILGAFRSHETQLSSDIQKYFKECDVIKPIRGKSLLKFVGKVVYLLSIISTKNKIIITKKGIVKKVNNMFLLE